MHFSRPRVLALLISGFISIVPVYKVKAHSNDESKASSSLNSKEVSDSFQQFRTALLAAVHKKDGKFIESILSPDVLTSLGGAKGKEAFLQEWEALTAESRFWRRFSRVLEHGAQYDEGTREFHAPDINFADSHSELPQAIVWNRKAVLYNSLADAAKAERSGKPDVGKTIPGLFGRQVCISDPALAQPIEKAIVKIKTKTGQTYFIKSTDIYSAYDEFAVFKCQDGKWQLTWFGYASL